VPRYIWERPDWPRWRWSESDLASAILTVQRKRDFLAGLAQGLDSDHLNLAITELMTAEIVSTSAIEGVKLNADEVRSSIMRPLGLGTSDQQFDRLSPSARGVIDVLADSTQNLETLTLNRLFAWHQAMFPSSRSPLVHRLIRDNLQLAAKQTIRARISGEAPHRPSGRAEAHNRKNRRSHPQPAHVVSQT
jgi:Fic family protein